MESSKAGMLEKDRGSCAKCMQKTSDFICDCHQDRSSEESFCDTCSKVFPNNEVLMLHKWVHKWEEKNQKEPSTRGAIEPKKRKAKVVLKESLSKLWYFCPSCTLKFRTKSELLKHTYFHTGKENECEVCGRLYSTKKKLKRHLTSHVGKTKICSVCGKTFSRSEVLSQHIKTVHLTTARFKCEICLKTYGTKSNLNTHKRLHSTEEFLSCAVCQKRFQTKGNLKAHSRKHMESILSL